MDAHAWENHYHNSRPGSPAELLVQRQEQLHACGTALDIAMGSGENAVFLARHGLQVTGVDRSSAAVAQARALAASQHIVITAREEDIRTTGILPNTWDVIVNFNFLERSLLPAIAQGLKIGGLLFFETYTAEQTRFGPPHNPDYLLRPNELLASFADLFVLFYHERTEQHQARASLIARRVD